MDDGLPGWAAALLLIILGPLAGVLVSHAMVTTYELSDLFELPIFVIVWGTVAGIAVALDTRLKRPRG